MKHQSRKWLGRFLSQIDVLWDKTKAPIPSSQFQPTKKQLPTPTYELTNLSETIILYFLFEKSERNLIIILRQQQVVTVLN